MVEDYMRENTYPPSSPSSILEYANKKIVNKHKLDVENAWQKLKNEISSSWFYTIQSMVY